LVVKRSGSFSPVFIDVFIRGRPSEGVESLGEVLGYQEGMEMFLFATVFGFSA
jgi:hypothetical protein